MVLDRIGGSMRGRYSLATLTTEMCSVASFD